jgi:tRNA G10  N-methylase Trm11
MDAQRLRCADGTFDRIICNLPWDRQVSAGPAPDAFYRRSLAEMVRVLAPGGRIVLLTAAPQLVQHSDLRCLQRREISLHGQRPCILVCARR